MMLIGSDEGKMERAQKRDCGNRDAGTRVLWVVEPLEKVAGKNNKLIILQSIRAKNLALRSSVVCGLSHFSHIHY